MLANYMEDRMCTHRGAASFTERSFLADMGASGTRPSGRALIEAAASAYSYKSGDADCRVFQFPEILFQPWTQ